MSRLRDLYENEITKKMTDKFGYKNPMMVPKIDKIVINMGVGEAKENSKLLDAAVKELETISGQKVVLTRAKNSIANFKLREGQAIGCKVTLRGEKMYEFLDRLVNLALPRVRDFRGVCQQNAGVQGQNNAVHVGACGHSAGALRVSGHIGECGSHHHCRCVLSKELNGV